MKKPWAGRTIFIKKREQKQIYYKHYSANDIKKYEGLYSSLWCINTPTFFPFLCSFCGNMLLLHYLMNMRTKERNKLWKKSYRNL